MSRPPGATVDHYLDALHAARTRITVDRRFAAGDLPRLLEAGAGEKSQLNATFRFTQIEGKAAVDGSLTGDVWLTCQRCTQPVAIAIDESFEVVIVADEDATPDAFGGYEPIAVEATRLDLQWLAEEQTLLALPLVPMHEPDECIEVNEADEVVPDEAPRQQPFGDLRELLKKR